MKLAGTIAQNLRFSRTNGGSKMHPVPRQNVRTEEQSVIFEEIARLAPALRVFARRFDNRSSDRDDLVQETMMKAMRNIHRFEPGTNLKAWLFRILRNTFYNSYQTRKREPVGKTKNVEETEVPSPCTQELMIGVIDVKTALALLAPARREALMLMAEGAHYDEAAAFCGCSIGTIKSRVHRGRADLVRLLNASEITV